MQLGTFSDQRQKWKTPRGPPGGALLLFMQRWCTVGDLLGVSSSMECEFLSVSCPRFLLSGLLYIVVFYSGYLTVLYILFNVSVH